MKNFKLLTENVDMTSALQEILDLNMFDWLNLRKLFPNSPHREANDIILRFCPLDEVATGNLIINRIAQVNYFTWHQHTEVQNLITKVFDLNYFKLGRVMITKLKPFTKIYPHRDEGLYANHNDRYHFVLSSNPDCLFKCGDEQVNMKVGEVWTFRHDLLHSVSNEGPSDRIHLIVDLRK